MSDAKLPMIVIAGRPNVGKSTLFNRIVGRRISIVHEQSGVTRDRIAARVSFHGRDFLVMDTGGLAVGVKQQKQVGVFEEAIRDQVVSLVDEAALIIWVVDAQAGILPQDEEMAELLRRSGCRVALAANKADNETMRATAEGIFSAFGFPDLFAISCSHNRGIDELLEHCLSVIGEAEGTEPSSCDGSMKLAVVGRPNVGKSSLVNRLFGGDRVIVDEMAGTTRDAVDVLVTVSVGSEEIPFTFIDTAGLRRKRRIDTPVEYFSVNRAEKAIRRSDAVLLVTEAVDPGTAQDRRIAHIIKEAYKPCIIVLNKWDLVKEHMPRRDLEALLRHFMPFMQHAPIQTVSALTGEGTDRIFDLLMILIEQIKVEISTSVVNRFVQNVFERTPPAYSGTKRFKIYYATMTGNPPPEFTLFVNSKRACPAEYLKFLENRFREAFFPETGLPVCLKLRERRSDSSSKDGTRQAIRGIKQQEMAEWTAKKRRRSRKRGFRKKGR